MRYTRALSIKSEIMQPSQQENRPSSRSGAALISRLVEWIVLLCLGVVLILHIFTSTFTRLIADDYCTAAFGLRDGLIGGLVLQYQTWAGQFSNILVKNFAGMAGIQFIQLLPLIILLSWLLTATWAFRQVFLLLRVGESTFRLPAFCAGLIFVACLIMLHPYAVQSVYWMAALVPYVSPLVIFTLWIGCVARFMGSDSPGRTRLTAYMVLTSGLSFAAAGFSETFLVVQTAALSLFSIALLLFSRRSMRNRMLLLMSCNFAAIVLAAILIIAAPGNAVRMSQFSVAADAGNMIGSTIMYGISFVFAALFVFAPATTVAFAGLSVWLGYRLRPALPPLNRYVPVLWLLATLGIALPFVAVGMVFVGTLPPARTYIIPLFFISILLMSLGIWVGARLVRAFPDAAGKRRRLTSVLEMLLVVSIVVAAIVNAGDTLRVLPAFQSFAAEWDQRDTQVRLAAAQGIRDIQLPPPVHDLSERIGVVTISASPEFWINQCAARLYGVDTIIVAEAD
jgi:hypothetical protein